MSGNNNSFISNKEGKSSKIIIISKHRIESAKQKVNFITVKEGDLKITMQMCNDKIDKQNLNNEINNIKQQLLINSKSYVNITDNPNINKYYRKKNVLITPNRQTGINIKKNQSSKKNFLYAETLRSINVLKTTENNIGNQEEDEEKKMETIIPYENKSYINVRNIKKNVAEEKDSHNNTDNNNHNNNKKKNNITEIMNISVGDEVENENGKEKENHISNNTNNIDNNNINDNNEKNELGIISRNYFNSIKNSNKKENLFDKYKSEEIKFLNSNSSRDKRNSKKNNNYIDKNNQRSDKTAKSISEPENENKNKIVSKLVLDSIEGNNGENNNGQRLITEYDYQYINVNEGDKNDDDLISESKNSEKTINIEDNNDENNQKNNQNDKKEEEEDNKIIYNEPYNNVNCFITNNQNENDKKEKQNSLIENNQEQLKKEPERLGIISRSLETKKNEYLYRLCKICEHIFPLTKLFVAECNTHLLCRKCAKNYYEDIIENGVKEMLCPFIQCKEPVDLEDLQKIISAEHFNILKNNNKNLEESKNTLCLKKIKSSVDNESVKLYTKKHVIDINSNKNFYNYYNAKDVYCPNCFMESLFSKTNTNFYRCLNCCCKKCKYCLKECDERHFDLTNNNHCKVYFRFDDEGKPKITCLYLFFLQLFFVIASYYICFAGTFLLTKNKFVNLFQANAKKYFILYFFAYFFSIICFIICIPFIVLIYPYFPSIMAICDY